MELLNNQVTREQTIHSPRSNNLSFALYLLAENINVPTTVLDFPSWKDFTRQIRKGQYSHVGISFITPNLLKTKRMAEYVRATSPQTKIILGGHGTAIPNLSELIDYDEICRGDGVAWLREYFGEDPEREIIHPVIPTSVNSYIYGAPNLQKAGLIIPGVGCQNSCRFCATSHKFDRKYTPFLRTGRKIFDACRKAEEQLSVTDFGMMDENFCKHPERAAQLLVELEAERKPYTFATFSSAETIQKIGVDFLVRLGVDFLWIGVESKEDIFEKTRGIDMRTLIAELQNHGITVLASAILFLEHHDKDSIEEEIQWAIGLESDLLQFMQLGPVPGTRLYQDYLEAGKLRDDIPWQAQHGQDTIWFHHPHFTAEETHQYLKKAFVRKYHTHGPGVMNMAWTALKGYRTVKWELEMRERLGHIWNPQLLRYVSGEAPHHDSFMQLRLESIRKNALKFRPVLESMLKYSPNESSREKCGRVIQAYEETLGPMTIKEKALNLFVKGTSWLENLRYRKNGVVMRQPPSLRKVYPARPIVSPAILPAEVEEPAA
jgi:hypothetical protein